MQNVGRHLPNEIKIEKQIFEKDNSRNNTNATYK